jgi:Sec-independent protein translocase protein TatA
MFNISWTELGVVTAVGIAVVGRKDLPAAARTAGTYTGRFVGWLQGMRTRADRFTAQHELSTLQTQVRSSLRELQAVQAEMMSASSVQQNRIPTRAAGGSPPFHAALPPSNFSSSSSIPTGQKTHNSQPNMNSGISADFASTTPITARTDLPPASRTIAAVAETEWARQGLGFTSRAELGNYSDSASSSLPGSVILARALQESLVYDQYDRVIREQQRALNPSTNGDTRDVAEKDLSKSVTKEKAD